MGKARILQAHGEGRYTIEIIEARERAEFAKQEAQSRIQTLQAELTAIEQRIANARAAVNQAAADQDAAINQYQKEVVEEGQSSVNIEKYAQELLEAAKRRDALVAEQRSKALRIAADEALIARVNALPSLRQMQAWCADYTEDLSGEVATAEVPGEIGNVIIKPGFEGNTWSAKQDGAMQPTLASTPAATFYNLAMLPGWQKWRSMFRTATITSLDGDICSITLDAATSSQQGLGVNARASYSNVPILYMDCNGGAFEEGDKVLVAFAGNVEGPTVVGFEQDPRACDIYITYRSYLQDYYLHRSLASDYEDYPAVPASYLHDRYVYRFTNRTNPSSVAHKLYAYTNKSTVNELKGIRDQNAARSFMAESTKPVDGATRVNTPENKEVSVGTVTNRFSFSYHDKNSDGEIVTRSALISDVGLSVPGRFIQKQFDIKYSTISVSDTEISISYTDAPSAGYGMFASGQGSELRLSENLGEGVGLSIDVSLSFGDFPESISYSGKTYVPNRFLQFAHNAPFSGNDVYLEYIREDYVDKQP